jgi:hypothetical protein
MAVTAAAATWFSAITWPAAFLGSVVAVCVLLFFVAMFRS